jgi:small subunit ribosomal protein S6
MALSMRDAPGTQREYETIFILRPDTPQDGILSVNNRVKGIIDQTQGKLLKVDNWGKRKLAYEIRKQLKGIYLYWRYLGTSGVVAEIERNLRMLDAVIRYYTIVVDQDVDPNARPSDVTDETVQKAATTGPDEEEIVTGAAAARGFGDDDDMYEDDYVAPEAAAVVEHEAAAPEAPAEPTEPPAK